MNGLDEFFDHDFISKGIFQFLNSDFFQAKKYLEKVFQVFQGNLVVNFYLGKLYFELFLRESMGMKNEQNFH